MSIVGGRKKKQEGVDGKAKGSIRRNGGETEC